MEEVLPMQKQHFRNYAFISYSSMNKSTADSLRDILNNCGIPTWMAPYDLVSGAKYSV